MSNSSDTFRDYIPAGQDTGAIGDKGFQDYIPAPAQQEAPVIVEAEIVEDTVEEATAEAEDAEVTTETVTETESLKCTYCPFEAKNKAGLVGHTAKHLKKGGTN